MNKNQWPAFVLLRVIAAATALWAIDRHPYNYYILTRWIVCGVCCVGLSMCRFRPRPNFVLPYLALAILFNPFAPFRFTRDTWQPLDAIAGIILAVSLIQKPTSNTD